MRSAVGNAPTHYVYQQGKLVCMLVKQHAAADTAHAGMLWLVLCNTGAVYRHTTRAQARQQALALYPGAVVRNT